MAGFQPPRGPVETEFLRRLLLGNGIAPNRLLSLALAVLPLAQEGILTAAWRPIWVIATSPPGCATLN